jgi:hypothetical protein
LRARLKIVLAKQILEEAVYEYHLEYKDIAFWTPYWINWATAPYHLGAPYAGKGTPTQLRSSLIKRLAQEETSPQTATQLQQLMVRYGLGIDCSGLAYHLLWRLLRRAYGIDLADILYVPKVDVLEAMVKPSWQKTATSRGEVEKLPSQIPLRQICQRFKKNPRYLTNVARLCSDKASIEVKAVKSARPGDLIKMTGPSADHVAVIIDQQPAVITYTDSRPPSGVSVKQVKVVNPDLGLEAQIWPDDPDYHPNMGDRLCRLRAIT